MTGSDPTRAKRARVNRWLLVADLPHVAAGVFRFLHANPGHLELDPTAYNKRYLVRPEDVAFYQKHVRDGFAAHFASRNHEDYTMVECNLFDGDDGIHCLGIGQRYQDWTYIADDSRIDRPRSAGE